MTEKSALPGVGLAHKARRLRSEFPELNVEESGNAALQSAELGKRRSSFQ